MKTSRNPTPIVLTLLASSMLVACNGSESDQKLTSPSTPVSTRTTLSGVTLDGYLKHARVCIDINRNLSCDSADGNAVLTNDKGQYKLPLTDIDLSKYALIVEAIPNQTIDMDRPNEVVEQAFVFSAPANKASLVTPYTTIISGVAAQQGIDFKTAQVIIGKQLNLDSSVFDRDYVANGTPSDQALHLLAQSLTSIMQEGEQASVHRGVSRLDAREGTQAKLGFVDLAALKTQTDKLVGTTSTNNSSEIAKIAHEFVADVTVSPEEVVGNQVVIIPPAPRTHRVNDAADTFDWSWVGIFTDKADYEFSLDHGKTWQPVTMKPLSVGTAAYAIGDVQVRIMANQAIGIQAGKVNLNSEAYTETHVPSAPSSLVVNDAMNQFDWVFSPTFVQVDNYEYSLNGGVTWQQITQKPQTITDIEVAAGQLNVRVAADPFALDPHLSGKSAISTEKFTVTPSKPIKPTLTSIDDEADSFDWSYILGFTHIVQYEVSLNHGKNWEVVSEKPLLVGNTDINAGSIYIRVAANIKNGMPAGEALVIEKAFTKQDTKPLAPKNVVVDDANNTIDWDWVTGYSEIGFYEISLEGVSTDQSHWNNVGNKPASVPENNFEKGAICLRVKKNIANDNPIGEAACSSAYFTVKPDSPTAPIIDDENNTFGWTLVPEYPNLTSYKIKIENSQWQTVTQNPYQLEDKDYATESIQVKVSADTVTGRIAGDILKNDIAYTSKVAPSDVTLLTLSGTVTQNRSEAVCAKMQDGVVWQLFNVSDSSRFKAGQDIYAKLKSFDACGITNWRIPTILELQNLFSEDPTKTELKIYDTQVFSYMNVTANMIDDEKSCYLSSDASTSSTGYKACLDISKIKLPKISDVKGKCSSMCFFQKKPLYRFISK